MEYAVTYGKGKRKEGFKDINSAREYAYKIAGRTNEIQIWKVHFYQSESLMGLVKRMKKGDLSALKFGMYYQEGVTYYHDWARGASDYVLNKDGSLGKRIE